MKRSLLYAAALLALFVAALVANRRLAGTSPIVWVDTFNDQQEVERCLAGDSCTLTGVQTSLRSLAHAVAWLELRTLLAWLGLGLDGSHLAIQALNALAVVLVFHLATHLGGVLAGVVAAGIFMDRIDAVLRVTALHNSCLLLFLGAVLVLACTAVVARPGAVSVALAALVAALMANVHAGCVLTGASVAWVALTAPRHRAWLAAFGLALFASATYAMAPPTWQHNVFSVLEPGFANGPRPVVIPPRLDAMLGWTLFGVGAWTVSLFSRAPAIGQYRRRALGAVAVIVPFVASFLMATRLGFNSEAKYLVHLKAACAIAAALPLALVGDVALRTLSPRLLLQLERGLPFVLALAMALGGSFGFPRNAFRADDERVPTVGDLAAIAHVLRDERGWDVPYMLENLKTPYGVALLNGLGGDAGAREPGATTNPAGSGALAMVLDLRDLPDPLPANWRVVRRSDRFATVLVFLQSRINWSEFEVCTRPAGETTPHCEASGWRFGGEAPVAVANWPTAGQDWRGTVELSFTMRPATGTGSEDEIFMPHMPFVCSGRITAVPAGARVEPDGRHATITLPDREEQRPSIIRLEWEVGSAECQPLAFESLPPFFIEGDAATVRLVEPILRNEETVTPSGAGH
jgi:hypothetical protein